MILTDADIRAALEAGEIEIAPPGEAFDQTLIQPASIDLRVGNEGATTKHKQRVDIREKGLIILEPGDFGVICILEQVKFGPQHVGRLGLRSKWARMGLIATTGPQIDPGFEGSITLGLANFTPKPIPLAHGDHILTLEIHRLDRPVEKPYDGPYQGKYGLSSADLEAIGEGEGMAFSEVLTTLRLLSENVAELESTLSRNVADLNSKMSELIGQMRTQSWLVPLIVGVPLAAITIIVGLVAIFR